MIFRPKKNIYFPERKLGTKKFQPGKLHPVGFWHDSVAALDTTVTIAESPTPLDQTPDPTSPQDCFAYGYDNGIDYFGFAAFGNIGNDTYTDGSSLSRTISAIYWTENCGGTEDQELYLNYDQTNVPDTDNSFVSIDYNGTNYARTGANQRISITGRTTWIWTEASQAQSGTVAFKINL